MDFEQKLKDEIVKLKSFEQMVITERKALEARINLLVEIGGWTPEEANEIIGEPLFNVQSQDISENE